MPSFADALRALAAAALARLPDEPHLHGKRLLAEHARDDMETAELLGPIGAFDFAGDLEDHAVAYGIVKPALADAARTAIASAPEDDLRGLVQLLRRQERHVDELPPTHLPEPGSRDPFIVADPGDDPIHVALGVAEAIARSRDPARAGEVAAIMERIAELDAERTRAGAPWGT